MPGKIVKNISYGRLGMATYLLGQRGLGSLILFISHNQWNMDKLQTSLPANLVSHVQSIKFCTGKEDQPIWIPNHIGSFSSKSAWTILRKSKNSPLSLSKIQSFFSYAQFIEWQTGCG